MCSFGGLLAKTEKVQYAVHLSLVRQLQQARAAYPAEVAHAHAARGARVHEVQVPGDPVQ